MSLPSRAVHFIRTLPDHPLLDRLVRGRAWIPVLGVMLAGIVAMQVEVLKLNASMGRSIALASSLQTRNELLRTSVSSLSDAKRIERLATRMGMAMPGPTAVDFLRDPASAAQAVAGIHAPDAGTFDSALQASAAAASATSTPTPSTASPTSASAAGTTSPAGAATTTPSSATPVQSVATPATTATGVAGAGATGTGTTAGTTATGTTATGAAATGGAGATPGARAGTTNPGGAAPAG